jgi:putative hemolysin
VLPALLPLCACAVQGDPPLPQVGLANPASVYCAEQGGRVVIRETDAGQVGDCRLPDGRVVEEWALYRAANP